VGIGARTGDTQRGLRPRVLAFACLLALAVSLACASSALAKRSVDVAFSCTAVSFTFEGFPSGVQESVTELVRGEGGVILAEEKFTFTGPTGSNTVTVALPGGHHLVKAEALWKTNGTVGESGKHRERLQCTAPHAALSVQKLQEIAGVERAFTAGELQGKAGETVDYQIIVSNSGNVPLFLSAFSDPNCEAETIAGGQGETPLAAGEKTVYTCSRKLTESGFYKNIASVTGTPEGGKAIAAVSNEVVVAVSAKPQFEVSKLQEVAGTTTGYTGSVLSATVGQTIDYEIVVKNTGGVALVLSEFTDVYCDPGTLSGGPGGIPLAVGASTVYTCTRKLNEVGNYTNVASVEGAAVGSREIPKFEATNTVKVKVDAAAPSNPGESSLPGTGTGTTTTTTTTTGTGTSTGTSPSGGVLSSKATTKHKKRVPHTTSHRTPRFTG
jgi:hypothetical protein